ncbi:hypothetical protein FQA39_LY09816 [Lamprigera yunnana]|nr:hypothetical protein FQA39_LY09816 [Lamprigera yunnana]
MGSLEVGLLKSGDRKSIGLIGITSQVVMTSHALEGYKMAYHRFIGIFEEDKSFFCGYWIRNIDIKEEKCVFGILGYQSAGRPTKVEGFELYFPPPPPRKDMLLLLDLFGALA